MFILCIEPDAVYCTAASVQNHFSLPPPSLPRSFVSSLLQLQSRLQRREKSTGRLPRFSTEPPTFLPISMVTREQGSTSESGNWVEQNEMNFISKPQKYAISNSKSEKHQDVAWKAVCPSVILLKKFYEFALELETALCDLLTVLCSPDMPAIQHLEKQQAITKQFAEILHFTLSFDDLKMTSPAIQNDFSYYRRTLNRRRMEDTSAAVAELSDGVDLPDDVANRMSLFYANPTPMLNTLSGAAEKLLQEWALFRNPSLTLDNMTNCFSAMASVCGSSVTILNTRPGSRVKRLSCFCLRVMVGVIILYDHVHLLGPLLSRPPLMYSTKHFNEDSTPKATKELLS
ncbi:CYFIP-related Rac1 interactor B [Geodia barretti]|uniref:CYFIP-related Rac1 interactor B n=2 Tax=Geodia barretti TaxID=519541 RepID=A0AA35TXU8_GEOBA|nr:CYFIP-related Rac1 interactor B [Geodia barretti]